MADFGAGLDEVNFTLWSAGEELPDQAIWTGSVAPGATPDIYNVQAADVSGASLIEGEDYWVTAVAAKGVGTYAWFESSFGAEADYVFDTTGGTEWLGPAVAAETGLRVNIDPISVPEPGVTLPLLAIGAMFMRRCNRI